METPTLEQKINEEISKHRFSPYQLSELLTISKNNEEIRDLFREFADDENLMRLLTLHRLDLFGFETDVKVPYFLFCNLPKANGAKTNNVSSALKFIISEKIENVEDKGMHLFNSAVGEAGTIANDFKDIVCYVLIEFMRENKTLLDLANAEKFNYSIMKNAVKDYENTVVLKEFIEKKTTGYFNPEVVDPEIKNKIEKVVLHIISNVMSKIDQTLENFQQLFPDLTLYFHKQSIIWVSALLDLTEIAIEDYGECLNTMFRIKAIQNKHIVTWCESCNKHAPSFEVVTGKIAPSNLTNKRECLQCENKKHYSFSAIYGLSQGLKDILNSKDGILATYFAWLLDKNNISFETSKYAGKYETDVLVKGKHLIECKLFRIDKDENALFVNVRKAFTQLEKQIQKFKDDGITIEKAYLLWNLEIEDKDIAVKLDGMFKFQREKYGFQIIPYDKVSDLINLIK